MGYSKYGIELITYSYFTMVSHLHSFLRMKLLCTLNRTTPGFYYQSLAVPDKVLSVLIVKDGQKFELFDRDPNAMVRQLLYQCPDGRLLFSNRPMFGSCVNKNVRYFFNYLEIN